MWWMSLFTHVHSSVNNCTPIHSLCSWLLQNDLLTHCKMLWRVKRYARHGTHLRTSLVRHFHHFGSPFLCLHFDKMANRIGWALWNGSICIIVRYSQWWVIFEELVPQTRVPLISSHESVWPIIRSWMINLCSFCWHWQWESRCHGGYRRAVKRRSKHQQITGYPWQCHLSIR